MPAQLEVSQEQLAEIYRLALVNYGTSSKITIEVSEDKKGVILTVIHPLAALSHTTSLPVDNMISWLIRP